MLARAVAGSAARTTSAQQFGTVSIGGDCWNGSNVSDIDASVSIGLWRSAKSVDGGLNEDSRRSSPNRTGQAIFRFVQFCNFSIPARYSRQTDFTGATMGRRGPPPTDVKILRLRGTWRSDRHAQVPPPIRAPGRIADIEPPGWFDASLSLIWSRILQVMPKELLGAIDSDLLAVLCEAIDRHGRAVVALREAEKVPTTAVTAEVIATLTKRLRHAATDVRTSAASLGITPAARARMALPEAPGEERYLGKFVRIA